MTHSSLDTDFLAALRTLCARLDDVAWVVTASTNLALRGLPVEPNDIDVMTDKPGAYEIERRFDEYVVRAVSPSESVEKRIASHFGVLDLGGVPVEIMGDVEHYVDGEWVSAADVAIHREFIAVDDQRIPVMPVEQEREGYRDLGRDERVRLIESHLGGDV